MKHLLPQNLDTAWPYISLCSLGNACVRWSPIVSGRSPLRGTFAREPQVSMPPSTLPPDERVASEKPPLGKYLAKDTTSHGGRGGHLAILVLLLEVKGFGSSSLDNGMFA